MKVKIKDRPLKTGGGEVRFLGEGGTHPSEEQIQQAVALRQRLNTVIGEGCGYCTQRHLGRPTHEVSADGSKLRCAFLILDGVPDVLTDAEKEAVCNCKVPALYSDVFTCNQETVAVDEIRALVPDLDGLED